MSTAVGQVVGVGPEVGDLGDLAVVCEVKEAQAGLRALLAGELDPAGGVLAFADDPLHGDVPVIREALHVEPDVGFPPADLLPGLRAAVDHVAGQQGAERVPVPGLRRGPVGRDYLMRVGHATQTTRTAAGPALLGRRRRRPALIGRRLGRPSLAVPVCRAKPCPAAGKPRSLYSRTTHRSPPVPCITAGRLVNQWV